MTLNHKNTNYTLYNQSVTGALAKYAAGQLTMQQVGESVNLARRTFLGSNQEIDVKALQLLVTSVKVVNK